MVLDPRHKTHNIPDKFLTYLQAGLPVLASINPGNDLIQLIEQDRVGQVGTDQSVESLASLVSRLVDDIKLDANLPGRCQALAARLFAPEAVVRKITAALAC